MAENSGASIGKDVDTGGGGFSGRDRSSQFVNVNPESFQPLYAQLALIQARQEALRDLFDQRLRPVEMAISELQRASNDRGQQSHGMEQRLAVVEGELKRLSRSMEIQNGATVSLTERNRLILAVFVTFAFTVALFVIYGQLLAWSR